MKTVVLLLLVCHWALAQKKDSLTIKTIDEQTAFNDDNTVYSAAGIDVKPRFPGGMEAFYKDFWKYFQMPNDSLKGRIFVSFTVEKDGRLSDIKILRDIGAGSGAAAIKAIKKLPKWQPARHNGMIIRCQLSLPISIPYEPKKTNVIEIQDK